ncbi:hypothetical protein [Cryobacterium sp. Y50]|uniref:hypothetical protein n=1 Tax=Cryobacterium sp. Y50 TaxID=2048286 RepID=UPI000CE355D9|nr:hypothetical protein [Cryobacterium sp. Y50]
MPSFNERDSSYSNVNRIADEQGLIWNGQYGSPYGIEGLISPDKLDAEFIGRFSHLFDHTQRFKPRGSGAKKPILAITSPYQEDNDQLRAEAQQFADKFDLGVRVNDPRDRVYNVESTIPILFWRTDLHDLV